MVIDLHEEIEKLLPVLRIAVAPQIQEAFSEALSKWKTLPNRNNFMFGYLFKADLALRLRANQRAYGGVYGVARVRGALFLDFLYLQMSFNRVDSRTGVPKGGKLVKESARQMGSKVPKQTRFVVIDGKAMYCPEPPRNVVLGIDAHPDYGLRQIFTGVLLPSVLNPGKFEYPKRFILYSALDGEA
jgi:hypothetical protein